MERDLGVLTDGKVYLSEAKQAGESHCVSNLTSGTDGLQALQGTRSSPQLCSIASTRNPPLHLHISTKLSSEK